VIVARARVRGRNYDRMRRVSPGAKPAQILIVEAKKRCQEIRVFFGRVCWNGFSLSTLNRCGFDYPAACCVLVH
jgi:hypothetical protein